MQSNGLGHICFHVYPLAILAELRPSRTLGVGLKAEVLAISSSATAQRWRIECAPGWRAALPGAPVRR